MKTTRKLEPRMKRKLRMRSKVAGNAERPRMCVYRSLCHIYVQLIDDDKGATLCSASTMSKDLQKGLKSTKSAEAAKKVGKALAEKALAQGITKVIFDRNGYKYHGRVKLLADSAREAGLNF